MAKKVEMKVVSLVLLMWVATLLSNCEATGVSNLDKRFLTRSLRANNNNLDKRFLTRSLRENNNNNYRSGYFGLSGRYRKYY